MDGTGAPRTMGVMLIRGIIGVLLTVPWLANAEAQEANEPNPTEVEFRQMVAELRKAGEPTTPADLRSPPIAPEKNGATYLRKAFALARHDDPQWRTILETDTPITMLDVEKFKLREFMRDLPAVIEHIDKAMACEKVDWEIESKSPAFDTLLPFLNELRNLSNYLSVAISVHRADGDHRAIIERVRQMMYLGRAAHAVPAIVGHLVSIGLDRQANAASDHLPTLRIGPGKTDAARPQVESVIRDLLNDAPSRDSLRGAYRGERIMYIDCTELVATRKLKISEIIATFDPGKNERGDRIVDGMARLADHWVSGKLLLAYSRQCLDEVDGKSWPSVKDRLPKKISVDGLEDVDRMLAACIGASDERPFRQHFLGVAERRLAATSLALQLYSFDHDGKLPATLNKLVPKYLPAVPLDPMTDGQPIRYIAGKRTIYSVGRNEKDDGGAGGQVNGTPVSDEGDMVFRIPTRQ
jgi:hypothetical protein